MADDGNNDRDRDRDRDRLSEVMDAICKRMGREARFLANHPAVVRVSRDDPNDDIPPPEPAHIPKE